VSHGRQTSDECNECGACIAARESSKGASNSADGCAKITGQQARGFEIHSAVPSGVADACGATTLVRWDAETLADRHELVALRLELRKQPRHDRGHGQVLRATSYVSSLTWMSRKI